MTILIFLGRFSYSNYIMINIMILKADFIFYMKSHIHIIDHNN